MTSIKNSKMRILLVVPSYACSPKTGGGQRTLLLYKALKNIGIVDLLIIGGGNLKLFESFFENTNNIFIIKSLQPSETGFWRFFRSFNPSLIDSLARTFRKRKTLYDADPNTINFTSQLQSQENYDLIVGRYLENTSKSGVLQLKNIPVILDLDDRDDIVAKSKLNRSDLNFIYRLIVKSHYQQACQIMSDLLPLYKHIWVASENDLQEITHPSKSVLPNIPYIFDFDNQIYFSENYDSQTILFVGTFGHRVNREAVENFIEKTWPQIRSAVKDATFRVIGSGGWENIKTKYSHIPNLEIVGFVENLEEEYEKAAFTVVPIFEGGGTKIKVLESLFYQRSCVVTHHAHYGHEKLKNGESLLVAFDELEFIDQCIKLLKDPNLRSQLADHGRKIVINEYSFNRFCSIIEKTKEKLF